MQRVNCSVAPAQLLPQLLLLGCAACAWVACAGSGAEDEPPNRLLMPLPTTWPIEEPIATPLHVRQRLHVLVKFGCSL
jgi:hypothetical protein